jgi:hypothetical protein
MRTVILPVGGKRDAFNWFIGNVDGFNQLEPSNNEFGVDDATISQAALDQKLIDYAADIAQVHSDFADFLSDEADERVRVMQVDNDGGLQSLIKVMVDELNAVRQNAGLPDLNLGIVTAAVRSNAKKP